MPPSISLTDASDRLSLATTVCDLFSRKPPPLGGTGGVRELGCLAKLEEEVVVGCWVLGVALYLAEAEAEGGPGGNEWS